LKLGMFLRCLLINCSLLPVHISCRDDPDLHNAIGVRGLLSSSVLTQFADFEISLTGTGVTPPGIAHGIMMSFFLCLYIVIVRNRPGIEDEKRQH